MSTMINGLGSCRFCAPWSRGAAGGSEAFVEHLQYFGYVLPSLTVLIAHREGWVSPKAILSTVLSIIMIAFLAQGGGRRIVGVVVGAALLTWVMLQGRIRPKVMIGGLIALTTLLFGMELMLESRTVGFSVWSEGSGGRLAARIFSHRC